MPAKSTIPAIPLPRTWPAHIKSAILQAISLAQLTMAYTRGWAADSPNPRLRRKAHGERTQQEIALLREELRIHYARMAQLPPHRRPYYPPTERMAILQLRAARGWSLEQTARRFLVTAETVSSWMKRGDEEGPDALVQLGQPVNKFPDFVRYLVQRLKVFSPLLGKAKIAQILARAGLHLGVTTVGRILKEKPVPPPKAVPSPEEGKERRVTAKYPNHVWLTDLTTVPIGSGFWTAWLPFSLPQCWPFCWWLGVVMDHYSRRLVGITLFWREPTSAAMRAFLGRVMHANHCRPKHLICDKGPQFWCEGFPQWCRRKGIKPRFGAIGKHGSIAVVERLILTLKQNIACLTFVALRRRPFQRELVLLADWYNRDRPHMTLAGQTPEEVYRQKPAANRQPRFEPRPRWSRRSPCARPVTLVKGQPGVRLQAEVNFPGGHRHLPLLTLRRAA
jgi:transposase InsO family protein